jgi:hypothetical protein
MMVVISLIAAALLTQQPPTPQPFPRPGGTQSARPAPPPSAPSEPAPGQRAAAPPAPAPAPPATAAADAAPSEATLGVAVYPGAQFIASYDAGRGQRYYLFGTIGSFSALVTYYRTQLKQRGELIFEAPATHQFDTGRFREEAMAFPPSVTIKDYQSEISQGYPNPRAGAEPARFPTIIQIVPASEAR